MEGFCLIVHYDRKRAEKDRKDREMSVGEDKKKLEWGI